MYRIDDHVGIAIAGLTSDARVLRYVGYLIRYASYPRSSCLAISCGNKPCLHAWFSIDQFPWTVLCLRLPTVSLFSLITRKRIEHTFNHHPFSSEAQVNTQEYGRRPYGVGFLVIGQDNTGPHLYEFSPSGNSYEYYAMSIGARSQSAKTYLEKHFESFMDCTSKLSHVMIRQLHQRLLVSNTWRTHPARSTCTSWNIATGQRPDNQ